MGRIGASWPEAPGFDYMRDGQKKRKHECRVAHFSFISTNIFRTTSGTKNVSVGLRDGRQHHDRASFFDDLISKSNALRIVLLEPLVGKLWRREYLEVVDVANLLVRIDINPNGCHRSLASLRRPQCVGGGLTHALNNERRPSRPAA